MIPAFRKYRLLYVVLLWCWTALVLYGSLAPGDGLPPSGWLGRIPGFDKIVHFAFYSGETALLLAVFDPRRSLRWLLLLATVFCSGVIELVQGAYLNRSCDIFDMAANVLGALFGMLVYSVLRKRSATGPAGNASSESAPDRM